jgi:cholesterol transport system auxiliary component
MKGLHGLALYAAASLLACGCALLNKSDSLSFRYFTPEAKGNIRSTAVVATASGDGPSLRLGRVNALSYLKDKIAFRDSEYEVGFYDLWQWTEKPESYLRRGMQRALFERAGLRQILSGAGPTLDLELDAFDELRGPASAARVRVTWTLHDDQTVLAQNTVTVERALALTANRPDAAPSALVAAMSEALGDAIAAIVGGVLPELSLPASPRPLAERVGAP